MVDRKYLYSAFYTDRRIFDSSKNKKARNSSKFFDGFFSRINSRSKFLNKTSAGFSYLVFCFCNAYRTSHVSINKEVADYFWRFYCYLILCSSKAYSFLSLRFGNFAFDWQLTYINPLSNL